jgi:hypothetical protein
MFRRQNGSSSTLLLLVVSSKRFRRNVFIEAGISELELIHED